MAFRDGGTSRSDLDHHNIHRWALTQNSTPSDATAYKRRLRHYSWSVVFPTTCLNFSCFQCNILERLFEKWYPYKLKNKTKKAGQPKRARHEYPNGGLFLRIPRGYWRPPRSDFHWWDARCTRQVSVALSQVRFSRVRWCPFHPEQTTRAFWKVSALSLRLLREEDRRALCSERKIKSVERGTDAYNACRVVSNRVPVAWLGRIAFAFLCATPRRAVYVCVRISLSAAVSRNGKKSKSGAVLAGEGCSNFRSSFPGYRSRNSFLFSTHSQGRGVPFWGAKDSRVSSSVDPSFFWDYLPALPWGAPYSIEHISHPHADFWGNWKSANPMHNQSQGLGSAKNKESDWKKKKNDFSDIFWVNAFTTRNPSWDRYTWN